MIISDKEISIKLDKININKKKYKVTKKIFIKNIIDDINVLIQNIQSLMEDGYHPNKTNILSRIKKLNVEEKKNVIDKLNFIIKNGINSDELIDCILEYAVTDADDIISLLESMPDRKEYIIEKLCNGKSMQPIYDLFYKANLSSESKILILSKLNIINTPKFTIKTNNGFYQLFYSKYGLSLHIIENSSNISDDIFIALLCDNIDILNAISKNKNLSDYVIDAILSLEYINKYYEPLANLCKSQINENHHKKLFDVIESLGKTNNYNWMTPLINNFIYTNKQNMSENTLELIIDNFTDDSFQYLIKNINLDSASPKIRQKMADTVNEKNHLIRDFTLKPENYKYVKVFAEPCN
jgi:hypothetical protein